MARARQVKRDAAGVMCMRTPDVSASAHAGTRTCCCANTRVHAAQVCMHEHARNSRIIVRKHDAQRVNAARKLQGMDGGKLRRTVT